MRTFEANKHTGNLDTHQVWKITAKHEQASYNEEIGEIIDGDIAASIVVFLNEREKIHEKNSLKKLADIAKLAEDDTLKMRQA